MSAAVMETESRDESKTVVVSGVPGVLTVSRMVDKLTIHFQSRRRSHGGDVEVVTYPTNMEGVAYVTFDKASDAENVVRKEQHIMTDNEFSEDYLLTVFPLSGDVFLYVSSAKVDLSVFGSDQASLIRSLRSAHRSLRFQPLPHPRKATIEGPFAAVEALREDLVRRAGQLNATVSAPTAAAGLRASPLNPRVISHHKFVSSVSCSGSKAKRGPADSNSLSTPLQSTGEATQVQSLRSNTETQNTSSRQKVSTTVRSFAVTDSVEGERLGARSMLKSPTEYRTKTSPRQVLGEEINAGIRSSLSGLDLFPAEEISANHPGVDDISQKHKTREENHLSSRHNNSRDYLKDSDQSSSAVATDRLQTRLKNVSPSSESSAEDSEVLSAICPNDPEDTSIWVDSHTYRYIEQFDRKELDRCLRGLKVRVVCTEGTDLMRIVLTEKQTSEPASTIPQAVKDVEALVEGWMLILRVHQIPYDEEKHPHKQKLLQMCKDVNALFNFLFDFPVLYMIEDSCIKVVGTSQSSYIFYKRVEHRLNSKTYL
ncbi:RNA-binding protein 43 [Seriola lalandi dorsalis]|uniref:RNA binding motif protein 43 n=1 Tax=Seriola lalandi dorsalis TaxID=1841481 RepID=A0A3B4WMH9_SERLL|nr:RNA-binding protein 43 [Seriola lalandi dorsalis]